MFLESARELLRTANLSRRAKIEQLVGLFGGEFRGGRAEAAPQLRKHPAVAGMVGALICEREPSSGGMADMRVLPHLMWEDEANDFFPIVKLDEGENQWASEFEQGIARPADELADPGLRGGLRTSAVSSGCADSDLRLPQRRRQHCDWR